MSIIENLKEDRKLRECLGIGVSGCKRKFLTTKDTRVCSVCKQHNNYLENPGISYTPKPSLKEKKDE